MKPQLRHGIYAFIAVLLLAGTIRILAVQVPAQEGATILAVIGLLGGAVGLCGALIGWYFFRQAEQITTRRINRALLEFRRKLGIEQAKYEEANRNLAAGYMQWFDRKDLNRAIAYFEQAVRSFPQGLGGYVALGHAYYSRGETEKALNLFQQALALFPDRKEPYRDLAGFFIKEGDLVRALEYIEKAVKVDPSVRRDILEDPLFDILKYEERTRRRYERALDV